MNMRHTSAIVPAALWRRVGATLAALLVLSAAASPALAQRHKWHDKGFEFRRVVEVPASGELSPEVLVVEFFTHGAMRPRSDVAVHTPRGPAPSTVMQVGPGDFCRVAIQTVAGQSPYYVYYGGQATDTEEPPAWTAQAGLHFETRVWKSCDLNHAASVRAAFAASPSIGSDVVGGVFHRHNPFAPQPGPFLSRYVGIMHAPLSGTYKFFTSSQDASFLSIDDQVIVAAPGAHPPESRARIQGEITLTAGPHRFEYLHAASGDECCMVAAWQLPGFDQPSRISPEVFRYHRVLRVPSAGLEHREDGYIPDFRMAILGDIPAPDDEPAMVRTQFIDASHPLLVQNATHGWSFGDGQRSEFPNPAHIFLHPGPYRVTLELTRGTRQVAMTSTVFVTRHFVVDAKGQEGEDLSSYLESLENYNAANLDAFGVVQLVRAYLQADDAVNAVQAAASAFEPGPSAHTDETRWALARLVGPALHERLDNPQAAARLWNDAYRLIRREAWRCEAALAAADIALSDLLMAAEAETLLRSAEPLLATTSDETRSRFERIRGDWHARTGNAEEARASYRRAATRRKLPYNAIEQNAWRGAHSRSTEAFLRSDELDRAREELERWQRDFPEDKTEGYWPLLRMRYWMARERLPQAVAVANDLLTVNPQSPYADRLLFLTAQCEEQQSRVARAVAAYQSLITDYPGSPLVERAEAEIARLQEGKPDDKD